MAKHTLLIEAEYDYQLIGIASHHVDYRLCWAINEGIGINLAKASEPFMVSGKKGNVVSEHSLFEYFDEDNLTEFYLIKNKNLTKFLIPEKPQIDYFLVIRENFSIEIDEFLIKLKSISSILTAFEFDPTEFKSSEHLIF